jgi:hypothetical protein
LAVLVAGEAMSRVSYIQILGNLRVSSDEASAADTPEKVSSLQEEPLRGQC